MNKSIKTLFKYIILSFCICLLYGCGKVDYFSEVINSDIIARAIDEEGQYTYSWFEKGDIEALQGSS